MTEPERKAWNKALSAALRIVNQVCWDVHEPQMVKQIARLKKRPKPYKRGFVGTEPRPASLAE